MSMDISVVNFTRTLKDEAIQKVIRAVNLQIALDFEPYWHTGAVLRLEGAGTRLRRQAPAELRGDAILYLWDKKADVSDAVGYHWANNKGLPYGFVFTQIARQMREPWSVTFSHEALELIGDPEANLFSAGPHPRHPERTVYFWYEMCDAVQDDSYKIMDVEVSNFVLPLYFKLKAGAGGYTDFLGRRHKGKRLKPFGVNPGGYVGFFDPHAGKAGRNGTFEADQRAQRRLKIRSALGVGNRGVRYGNPAR